MGKYFGTDGFRGEANVKLTVDNAFKVGRYVGWYYGRKHKAKIVIGKDTRRSSYMFEYALVAGLTASGADAYLLHVTTTPSVSFAVRTEDFDCGIMISASHNPFYDNGIKLLNGNGQKIEAEIEARIEAYLDGEIEELPLATGADIGRTVDFASGRNRYIGYLISIPSRDFKNVRVGLDCANGSSSAIAKSVFDALQAKTYVINNTPDGTNINTNCGSTHIEVLQKFVVDKGLDIGFAYDGDADRCIAVDHRGNVIDGDKIMYVCGKYLKEEGKLNGNKVVTTVMSNLGLYKAFDREGIGYEQTAVGDKYVAENMLENNYSIGGEQSGHIIFSRYAATGDGILTSLMLMEACVEKKATLCDLAKEMKVYPQVLRNVRVADKQTARENPKVKAAVEKAAKELGDGGRILVRESGTEPLIRVMVEAESDETCHKYVDDVVKELLAALSGKENRKGNYCEVSTVYPVALGSIVELLYSFKESRNTLNVPHVGDAFTKKLYSTYLSYLPKDKFGYPLKMNVDPRGSFTEIIRTRDQGQFSVNVSKPHITKGNHWHHTKNEKFMVVSGKGVIRFRNMNEEQGEVIEYYVSGDRMEVIDIPTGYTHHIENLGDTDMVTFMWCNECFDPQNPDTFFEKV